MNSTYPTVATPAPVRKGDLAQLAQKLFRNIVWIDNRNGQELPDLLSDYDFYEEYDENKAYTKRAFIRASQGKLYEYEYQFITICQANDELNFYVGSRRLPSPHTKLVNYCTCLTCSANPLNPLKYLWCTNCTGCLQGGITANPQLVELAQAFAKAKLASRSYWYQRWILKRRWILYFELCCLLLLIYLLLV